MYLATFTILLSFVSFILFYIYKHHSLWKYTERFPGPPTDPIIGHAIKVGSTASEHLENLMKWVTDYKFEPFRIYILNQTFIVVTDPDNVEKVLTDSVNLQKGSVYRFLERWLGEGLLTSFGHKWFTHRKMLTHSFHFQILLQYFEVMNNVSKKFIKHLKEVGKDSKVLNIEQVMHYCTLDVICETAMGVKINAIDDHDSVIVKSLQSLCRVVEDRAFSALKQLDLMYFFTPSYWEETLALKILKKFGSSVIQERKNQMESRNDENITENNNDVGSKKRLAFLDTLLTAEISGKTLDFQEIYEEVSTFVFEGHDTTSSGLTFTTYLIAKHPDVQKRIYEEQISIFGEDNKTDLTHRDLQDMKYLDLVIKESLRMYPPVPIIARQCTSEITLSDGKVIPKGATIAVLIIAMGYNEKHFKDPHVFNPERFAMSERTGENTFSYVPFSAGPRNCIGQKYALMEMKVVLSKLIRNFEISLPNDSEISSDKLKPKLAAVLTLKSENGVYVKLKPRQ